MTAVGACYASGADSPQSKAKPCPRSAALQSKSGKPRQSDDPDTPAGARPVAPRSDPSSRAQPRYLVTFDGLMEVPDMDDMIESLEREVEVIRSPALC